MEKWATNGPRCPEPPPHREAGAGRASPVPRGKPSPAAPGTARVPVAALGWAVGQEMVVLGKLRSPHTCARPGLLGEPTTECLSPGMWFSVWMADQPQMGPVTCREERAPGPWAPPALRSLTGEPQTSFPQESMSRKKGPHHVLKMPQGSGTASWRKRHSSGGRRAGWTCSRTVHTQKTQGGGWWGR